MPYINKMNNRRVYPKRGNSLIASKIYNSKKWKRLRAAYFMQNPLCENCLSKGITSYTEEIHHMIPILKGKDLLEMQSLAYDPNNLMALCGKCHHEIHNRNR